MVSFVGFTQLSMSFLLISPIASFVVPSSRTLAPAVGWALQLQHEESEFTIMEDKPIKKEYAALSPGCTVQIQVGNIALARKAWKKRRRSGSPLLVPCSVLDMDRRSMIQFNIMYLLEKFGKPLDKQEQSAVGYFGDDIALSMADINKYYSKHLRTSLAKHARALGHDTTRSLVRDIFNKQFQRDFGVRLWLAPKEEDESEDDCPMWLMAPLSKQRAHRMASQAALLQFTTDEEEERMKHTGVLRIRKKATKGPPHEFLPLSAALRVSQRLLDQGVIRDGSIHSAVVFSFDLTGDGGSPLLTLSLNPTRGQVLDRLKLKAAGKRHFSKESQVEVVGDLERDIADLKVGDGPFMGKVVRISARSGAAFVDCGVGRSVSEQKGGGITRVLGMLRFDDLVQDSMRNDESSIEMLEATGKMSDEEARFIEDSLYEDSDNWDEDNDEVMTVDDLFPDDSDEDEEDSGEYLEEADLDITDLLTVENGVISYKDPEMGEKVVVSASDVGTIAEDREEDTDSMFSGLSTQERLDLLSKVVTERDEEHSHDGEGDVIEEEIDITHLFSMEDGVMSYKDPESGETVVISNIDDDEDDDFDYDGDDEEEDDLFKNMTPEERLDMISKIMDEREQGESDNDDEFSDEADGYKENEDESSLVSGGSSSDSYQPSFVTIGDEVEVYIKSVYKQSGRFMVTLDSSVQERKAKDMKKQAEAEKKLARLIEKMGGEEGYQRIKDLEGTECNGVVQATSKTGDWCYVQPDIDGLPVGVARLSLEDATLAKGDAVRVRMDGIDESRGQLAMTVIK